MTQREVDAKAVRAWAHEHGVPVSARGRVSAAVVEQYLAAQPAATSRTRSSGGAATRASSGGRTTAGARTTTSTPDEGAAPEGASTAAVARLVAELQRVRAEVVALRAEHEDVLRRLSALEAPARSRFRRG